MIRMYKYFMSFYCFEFWRNFFEELYVVVFIGVYLEIVSNW